MAGLRARTERQDDRIAELCQTFYGKRSESLDPDDQQLDFEDLGPAFAKAEAARDTLAAPNADGITKRPAAKRNLGHLPRAEQVIEAGHGVCPCGCTEMVKIPFHGLQANHCRAPGEDRSERLYIIPARFQIIRCPAAHAYMRERGDDPPPICLSPLRWPCAASCNPGRSDRRRTAD